MMLPLAVATCGCPESTTFEGTHFPALHFRHSIALPASGAIALTAHHSSTTMRRLMLIALLVPATCGIAQARQDPGHGKTGKIPDRHCIDIEVNGERVRDYDCLSGLLMPSTGDAARSPAQLRSEEVARRPSTALGLANPEATRQRMGNTFGKSTLPQRPPPAPPVLPPAIRKP